LYYLEYANEVHQAHPSSDQIGCKAKFWHRRFGLFGAQEMEESLRSEMVGMEELARS